jgi:long-chain acyl-CoA synthetase
VPAGEYVAVEKIESVLKGCGLVEQVWVYGNSFESCLVAVVVPQEKSLKAWADKAGLKGTFEVRVCAGMNRRVC